mgnify:CR=1 FL=1
MPKATFSKDLQKAYANLRYDKVKEIVSSIPSINECLVKNQFEKDVNLLRKEEFHKIEDQIAEDILWTYSKKKFTYQSSRKEYFKDKIKTSAEKIKDADKKYLHKQESMQRKKEAVKMSRRYRTILSGLQDGKISLKQNKNDHLYKLYQ